jgi:SAM-dependent methyltransferase
MNYVKKLKLKLKKEQFQPTLLGFVINPVYVIRSGLFKYINKFAPQINGSILDFGCGSKPYENLFINSDEYIGCDIEDSGHSHHDSNIDYFFDGKTLPFDDDRFDSVVSFEVFEHVFNLHEILKEINRVTKTSGTLLISFPFAYGEHEVPYDYARYTSFGMSHILKEHGFEVIEYKKTTTHFLTIYQLFVSYLVQNIAPNNKFYYIFQIMIIFPLNIIAYALNLILPKNYDLYCSSVILAKKND